MRPFSAVNNF